MENKKTSIIILTFNKLEYTKQCIDSIRKYTPPCSYEIIVVDNYSTDGTVEWLKSQQDITAILNNGNLGFSKGCNQGIKIAQGDSILLLGNDVIVTPHWLENLIFCLYSSENIGAASPVTNYSYDHKIHVSYDTVDKIALSNPGFNMSNPEKWEERLVLSGFCMLIKKEVMDQIGLLDESLSHGGYEDTDYCFRIKKEGYVLLLCRDTSIHRLGCCSLKEDSLEAQRANHKQFQEKWGFNPSAATSASQEIFDLIDFPKSMGITVLEVGCACGANLLNIRNTYKNAELHGIESNKGAASIAATIARVTVQDIESGNLDYTEGYFDYIIFADILEHLKYPWNVLKNMKKYLKTDGKILAGIYNTMHYNIIRNLVNGIWSYGETGILGKSHLRFFTLNEIRKMFCDAGYEDLFITAEITGKKGESNLIADNLSRLSNSGMVEQFHILRYYVRSSVKAPGAAFEKESTPFKPKSFVTIFPEAENTHLTKDVGMIPYIMHKYNNYDSSIICYKNGEYPYVDYEVKGLKINFLERNTGNAEEDVRAYLSKNSANIDVLHIFHLCTRSFVWIDIYKHLNPKGKVYLKLDANASMKYQPLSEAFLPFLKQCSLISIETKHLYNYAKEYWPIRVAYIPNGFYDFIERKEVTFEEKENIICTAGRIGLPVKAHEVLMEAFNIASSKLPGWKLKMIGPIILGFTSYIAGFFCRYPHLKDKIIFTGEISDRRILEKEYRQSKIFCMTSVSESFGLVFVEAAKNGCFILSSNIIPAWDVTDNQNYGEILETGNIVQLADTLVKNCTDETRLKITCKPIQAFAYQNFYWVDICKKIDNLINEGGV